MQSTARLAVVAWSALGLGCGTGGDRCFTPGEAASPTLFLPGVVSTTQHHEWEASFAPNRCAVYFTRRRSGERQKIFVTRFEGGQWTEPTVASFSTDIDENTFITPDGSRFFFATRRRIPGKPPGDRSDNIWVMDRRRGGWGEPRPIDSVNRPRPDGAGWPTNSQLGPMVGPDDYLYFWTETANSETGPDIYRSPQVDGGYGEPERLGDPINTDADELSPFVSPDGSLLFFSGYGRPDGIGEEDIYVARREGDVWVTPRILSQPINSNFSDGYPRVSADGRYLFFASDRPATPEGPRRWRIYYVSMQELEVGIRATD